MMDHDYTSEFKWEKPYLSLNQLSILAVLNCERKSQSPEGIAMFLYKHFPYYKDTPMDYITRFLKTTNVVLQKAIYGPNNYCEFYIPADKEHYCIKRFQRFTMHHPDPRSPAYSMRYPGLWDAMSRGEYFEDEQPPLTFIESKPIEYPKPPIPERYLIGLAIMNSHTGRLVASEIFAFIERHFPYYRTADKKWKRQNANEALKAARGLFGKEKLSKPTLNDKLGNGVLNVYFIREDKMYIMDNFLEKFSKEHPDPTQYGMEHPELWPAMLRGEIRQNEEELRKLVFSWGKARTQLASTDRNPYERSEEQDTHEVLKPCLSFRLYALLAYLHLNKEFVFPSELYAWLRSNIYYFKYANPVGWKSLIKCALYKYFIKRPAENAENIKANQESMTFGLNERQKTKMVRNIIKFEIKFPKVALESHGVFCEEKWNRIFPLEYRELAERTIDEAEGEEEVVPSDDEIKEKKPDMAPVREIEAFVEDVDYEFDGEQSKEVEEEVEWAPEISSSKPPLLDGIKEEPTRTRYNTRRKKIDFNKMLRSDQKNRARDAYIGKLLKTASEEIRTVEAEMIEQNVNPLPEKKRRSVGRPRLEKRVKINEEDSKKSDLSTVEESANEGESKSEERQESSKKVIKKSSSQKVPSSDSLIFVYLAVLNSEEKTCSVNGIWDFLRFYFMDLHGNQEIETIKKIYEPVLEKNFAKTDSRDAYGDVRYRIRPYVAKNLRGKMEDFRKRNAMYFTRINKQTALWNKLLRGKSRDHLIW